MNATSKSKPSKRQPFTIGHATIAPGERRTVDLPISVFSDNTPANLSVHVIHGKRPGPVVFVSAGVHGDEIIGVEIVRRLLALPSLRHLRGTLMAIPIVNTYGFINRSRYLPDRRDLNRCFPGSSKGSLASRLAHLMMTEVVAKADLGIDLHSAAIYRTNLPQIRISPDNPETARLAAIFGAPVTLRSPLRDGSMRAEAKKMGVDVLLYEAGEGLRFDEMAIRAGVLGILRVLHDQQMVSSRGIVKNRTPSLLCQRSYWLRSPQGGLLRAYRAEGDVVEKDELLAHVAAPLGKEEHEVRALKAGVIIGRLVLPVVNEGDAIFHIAPVETDNPEDALDSISALIEDHALFDEDEII